MEENFNLHLGKNCAWEDSRFNPNKSCRSNQRYFPTDPKIWKGTIVSSNRLMLSNYLKVPITYFLRILKILTI